MADAKLGILLTADASNAITNLGSVNNAIIILQNQLDRLQKLASLPNLNLSQLSRIGSLAQSTQTELNKLQVIASRISPEFGKINNSSNELEKRIRVVTSAEHEFNSILGTTPALLAGVENPAQALGSEFLVLATGIQRAKESGQSFGEIGSTLAGSIFSLQGAITLGAAALFSFSNELFGSETGLKSSTIALQAYEQKLKDVNTTLEQTKSALAASETATASILNSLLAGIDPNSLKGLQTKKLIDTTESKQKVDDLNSEIRLTSKSLDDVNGQWTSMNTKIEILKNSLSDLKKIGVVAIDAGRFGGGTKVSDLEKLFTNFPDISKIPKEDLDKLSSNIKDFVIPFQDASKQIEDNNKKLQGLLDDRNNFVRDSNNKLIDDQTTITKKQGDLSGKQVDIVGQQVSDMKALIDRARSAQDILKESFIIPTNEIVNDKVLQQFSAQGQQLIKQKEDLALQLKQIDLSEQATGIDQSATKNKIQLQIFQIDKKLLQEQFDSATLFLQQLASTGFKIAIPIDVKPPKTISETDKAEFKKSLDTLLINISAPLKLLLDKKTLQEQLDDLNRSLNDAFKLDPKNILESLRNVKLLTQGEELDIIKLSATLDISPKDLAKSVNDIKSFLPKSLQGKLDIALQVGDIKTIGLLQAIAQMNEDISKALNEGIKNISVEGLSGLGDVIGEALSGGDLTKSFADFGKTIGQAVESLGKQIIALGVAAALAKTSLKVLFANPAVAIAAGLALVAIGAALENLLSKGIQGREHGGPVEAGKPYIVGEKRPELFVPKTSGTIIPYVPSESYSLSKEISEKIFHSYNIHHSIVNNFFQDHSLTHNIYQTEGDQSNTNNVFTNQLSNFFSKQNSFSSKLASLHQSSFSEIAYHFKNTDTSFNKSTNKENAVVSEGGKQVSEETNRTVIHNKSFSLTDLGQHSRSIITTLFEKNKTTILDLGKIFHSNFSVKGDKTTSSSLSTTLKFLKNIFTSARSEVKTVNNFFTNSPVPRIDFKKVTPFADGGLVFNSTFAQVGEGANISSTNPEVIAPLSDLKKFFPDNGSLQNLVIEVVGKIAGQDILLSNARSNKSKGRTG